MNRISEFSQTCRLPSPLTIGGSIDIQSAKLSELLVEKKTNVTSVVPTSVATSLLSKDTACDGDIKINNQDFRLKDCNS